MGKNIITKNKELYIPTIKKGTIATKHPKITLTRIYSNSALNSITASPYAPKLL